MAGLPRKLVTFLFTDVDGDAVLLERDADALSAAPLFLHGLIALHRGEIFRTFGDGFQASFERASAALDAALAIRDVSERLPGQSPGGLRVRIVLHTGEAEYRDNDYLGSTVAHAARFLDATPIGQVLMSAETVRMLDRDPPYGVALRDLGEIALKGDPARIHAYALEGQRAPGTPEINGAGGEDRPPVTPAADDRGGDRLEDGRPTDRIPDMLAIVEAPDNVLGVYTLGGFRLERGGIQIYPAGSKLLPGGQLFKCLITRERHRISTSEASRLFLEKSADDAAGKTMRSMLWRFRDAVEPDVPHAQSILDNRQGAIQIRPGTGLWVDADVFERICHGRLADHPDDVLEAADRLYRGDYLPDDPDADWAISRRDYLRRLWVDLQLELARRRDQRGDFDNALFALERLLVADACDEPAARELMLLLARHGRGVSALRVFQRLAEALLRELETRPSAETLELCRQIRDGEIQAASGPVLQPGVPNQDGAVTSGIEAVAEEEPAAPSEFESTYPFPEPELLVGRQRELLELRRALECGRSKGQTLLIGAPGGTGKSTLAGLLINHARSMGYLCLAGGSFDHDSPSPFASIRDALCDYLLEQPPDQLRAILGDLAADLVQIVPQLGDHLGGIWDRPVGSPDPGRQAVALERYLRRLASVAPIVLCLEDLHAADGATLEALHHLALRTRRLPVTLIGTYRTEEVSADRPLSGVLTALRRARLSYELILSSFDRNETHVLISSLLDGAVSEGLINALFDITEGNPLFVEQLILVLREEGRIERRNGVWHQLATDDAPVPPVIRAVIQRRFDRLPPKGREILEMAAVMGQTFEVHPLVVALGAADQQSVVAVLDRAIEAQLVHESANRYRFGHAMIREALYRGMSRPGRALLHARAGEAIERLAGDRASERAAELAHHFALAAEVAPTTPRAFAYSVEAGNGAAALSSFREALDHYSRAYTYFKALPDLDVSTRLRVLEGRALVERELGLWTSCIATCRNILAESDDRVRRGWARASICRALSSLSGTAEALREVDAGLAELRDGDDSIEAAPVRVRLAYDKAYLIFLLGRFREVYALGQETLDIASRLVPGQRHLAHAAMALSSMGVHNVDRAFHHLDEGIAAAEEVNARVFQAVFHENRGITHHRAGQLEAATGRLRRALELYAEIDADVRAVNAIQALGRVLLAQGDVPGARRQAEQALAFATDGRDRWAAECYDLLGSVQIVGSEWSDAVASFGRALAIHEDVGDLADTSDSLTGLGTVAELRGNWAEAELLYRRAIQIADQMDPCPEQVIARRRLARLLIRRGDVSEGADMLNRALALVERMLPIIEYGPTLLVHAERLRYVEPVADRTAVLERALAAGGAADFLVEAHGDIAEYRASIGDGDAARRHANEAEIIARRIRAPRSLGLARLAVARGALADGDHEAALDAFEAAMRALEAAHVPYDLAVATRECGRTLIVTSDDRARGRALVDAACSRFERLGARPDAEECRRLL